VVADVNNQDMRLANNVGVVEVNNVEMQPTVIVRASELVYAWRGVRVSVAARAHAVHHKKA